MTPSSSIEEGILSLFSARIRIFLIFIFERESISKIALLSGQSGSSIRTNSWEDSMSLIKEDLASFESKN